MNKERYVRITRKAIDIMRGTKSSNVQHHLVGVVEGELGHRTATIRTACGDAHGTQGLCRSIVEGCAYETQGSSCSIVE